MVEDVLRLFLIPGTMLAATDPSVLIGVEMSVGVDGRVFTSSVSTFSTMLGESGSGVLQPEEREPPEISENVRRLHRIK